MLNIVATILAGGAGTRLWPLSRVNSPKQFLAIGIDDASMLEQTVARLRPIIPNDLVTVVTSTALANGEAHAALQKYHKILEPCARNTAPAIGVAALQQVLAGEDPLMVVLPADHVIRNVDAFQSCLRSALKAAEDGALVTFGITPTFPDTGFGYIHALATDDAACMQAVAFKEKPDLETAKAFLAHGGYYWNSGMFVWRASAILAAIRIHLPALDAMLNQLAAAVAAGESFDAAMRVYFASAPSISIDHGVLEKVAASVTLTAAGARSVPSSARLLLVPADIGWSDVGSWDAVYDVSVKDDAGNSTQGEVIAVDCRNTMIRSQKRLIAAVGLEGISIVETADAILVAKHGDSQKVKQIVEGLANNGGELHLNHLTVKRPWGSYTLLEEGPGFKLKRIEVAPGGRLSLQSHQFRSEHWVVVEGVATVTCDDRKFELHPNESTFIPMRAKHRLENMGERAVQIIEVQVGSYVGEDDIKRFEDVYGRSAVTSAAAQ